MLQNRHTKKPAFSLIELIVLISVVALAFVGVMSLLNKTLQLQGMIKGNLVARALANEGIDLVAAIRNRNVTAGQPFYTNLDQTADPQSYFLAVDKLDITTYNPAGSLSSDHRSWMNTASLITRFYFDATNYYTHDSTKTPTNYYRFIKVDYNGEFIDVISTVTWKNRDKTFYYNAVRRLYDTAP